MGIDIGTYSSKGVLVADRTGTVVASHVVPHTIEMPQPGWVEQDADGVWWHDCVDDLPAAAGAKRCRQRAHRCPGDQHHVPLRAAG